MSKAIRRVSPATAFRPRDVQAELEQQGFVILDLNDEESWAQLKAKYQVIKGDWQRGERWPVFQVQPRFTSPEEQCQFGINIQSVNDLA